MPWKKSSPGKLQYRASGKLKAVVFYTIHAHLRRGWRILIFKSPINYKNIIGEYQTEEEAMKAAEEELDRQGTDQEDSRSVS